MKKVIERPTDELTGSVGTSKNMWNVEFVIIRNVKALLHEICFVDRICEPSIHYGQLQIFNL